MGSRFLPGTRLPLYVLAGALRVPGSVFAWWSFVAAVFWTPAVVLLTAALGNAFILRLQPWSGIGSWMPRLAAAAAVLLFLHAARAGAVHLQWQPVTARLARWRRRCWPM